MNTDHTHDCPTSDELMDTTKINIEKYGLQVMGISSTDYSPSFSYSVGHMRATNIPRLFVSDCQPTWPM
jgi:hypothetical protein